MDNPGIKEEIWNALVQKWSTLLAEGHTLDVEFKRIKDPEDRSKTLAIDFAQNIDGEWHVQTVQMHVREAYAAVGIEGLGVDRLIEILVDVVGSITKPIDGRDTFDRDELHLYMTRISPETSELHGYVIRSTGERVGTRPNYKQYYVINEILEQISKIMNEEYSEIQLHRKKDDYGKMFFQFIP